jgi:inosose dehydratase
MSVRIGVNPICWNNDDMQELGDEYSLEDYLAEGKKIGFAGFELGHKFPQDPKALKPILDRFGLAFVSGWYSSNLLERSVEQEIAAAQKHITLLKGLGCKVMIVAETSGCIHGQRDVPLSKRPRMTAEQWPEFCKRMTAFGDYLKTQGLVIGYHHHMGTVVETEAEVDRFMKGTGESVGLLLDTGHMTFAGGDPLAVAKRWGKRITHVHCKDVRPDVMKKVKAGDFSFLNSVVEGVFTVPSDGCVDYKAVLGAVKAAGYKGDWLVIEAEQDPAKANPLKYLTKGYNYLSSLAAELGL